MNRLLNRTITEIYIDGSHQHYLVFETTEGSLNYDAYGDCCSESYFAEISGVANLLAGRPVAAVEEMDCVSGDGTRQECDQIYGYKIRFGPEEDWCGSNSAMVVFRNSSNGYYGGGLEHASASSIPQDRMVKVVADYDAS
jgi:hypothetical protein